MLICSLENVYQQNHEKFKILKVSNTARQSRQARQEDFYPLISTKWIAGGTFDSFVFLRGEIPLVE
jgi:hypothetical protein